MKPWSFVPGCSVPGCPHDGTWEHPRGRMYCDQHSRDVLMQENEKATEEKRRTG